MGGMGERPPPSLPLGGGGIDRGCGKAFCSSPLVRGRLGGGGRERGGGKAPT